MLHHTDEQAINLLPKPDITIGSHWDLRATTFRSGDYTAVRFANNLFVDLTFEKCLEKVCVCTLPQYTCRSDSHFRGQSSLFKSDQNPCPLRDQERCFLTFEFKHKAADHAKKQHPQHFNHPCPCREDEECFMMFTSSFKALDRAKKEHPRQFSSLCPLCDQRFDSARLMKKHIARVHTKVPGRGFDMPASDEEEIDDSADSDSLMEADISLSRGGEKTASSREKPNPVIAMTRWQG